MEPGTPCDVWWDDVHKVARNTWKIGAVCRVQDAQAVTASTAALGRGVVPVLVDMRNVAKIERLARLQFRSSNAQAAAVALIVESAVSVLIARVMTALLTGYPARTFTNERAALAWLATHRPQPPGLDETV